MPLKRFETVADMATTPSLIGRERRYRLIIPDVMDAEEREIVKHAACWLACMNLLGTKDIEIRFSDTKPKDENRIQVVLTRKLCHQNVIDAKAEAKRQVMDIVVDGKVAGGNKKASKGEASEPRGSDTGGEKRAQSPDSSPEARDADSSRRGRYKLFCNCPPPGNSIWDSDVPPGKTMVCKKCDSWYLPKSSSDAATAAGD